MCALVSVDDRGPTLAERLAQSIETENAVQGVGKLPGEHVAAVPVDDSDQVHEASQQRYIGDVCAPDLVDMRNRQIAQTDRDSAYASCPENCCFSWVDRLDAHQDTSTV